MRWRIHTSRPEDVRTSLVKDTFGVHRSDVIKVRVLNVGSGVGFDATFVYAVTYIETIDKLSEKVAPGLSTMSMVLLLYPIPRTAWLTVLVVNPW